MSYIFEHKPPLFIAVEGIIGAGKTTFSKALAKAMDCKVFLEPVDENPYLARYYAEPKAWALHVQFHFMALRAKQADEIAEGCADVVSDRSLWGDMIFARLQRNMGILSGETFDTYCRVFDAVANESRLPNKTIYLKCDISTAEARIAKRGRSFESSISREYLEGLKRETEACLIDSATIVLNWNANRDAEAIEAEAKQIAKGLLL